jgi:hypothetical protein
MAVKEFSAQKSKKMIDHHPLSIWLGLRDLLLFLKIKNKLYGIFIAQESLWRV